MEATIHQTKTEISIENQKELSNPMANAEISQKRIRKRIKYIKTVVSETPLKSAVSQPNEISYKENIF